MNNDTPSREPIEVKPSVSSSASTQVTTRKTVPLVALAHLLARSAAKEADESNNPANLELQSNET